MARLVVCSDLVAVHYLLELLPQHVQVVRGHFGLARAFHILRGGHFDIVGGLRQLPHPRQLLLCRNGNLAGGFGAFVAAFGQQANRFTGLA